jgi:hypothetical protein
MLKDLQELDFSEIDMSDEERKELKALHTAQDIFSAKAFNRLTEKLLEGWRGWNDRDILPLLLKRLDAVYMDVEVSPKACLDIANLAMMIHYHLTNENIDDENL